MAGAIADHWIAGVSITSPASSAAGAVSACTAASTRCVTKYG